MNSTATDEFIAFEGPRRVAQGPLCAVALQLQAAAQARPLAHFLVFHAQTSDIREVDLRGTPEDVRQRLTPVPPAEQAVGVGPDESTDGKPADASAAGNATGPGRPRLGVVAREVTLLPRHWAWLSSQPGGASVTLRKLVEQAKREGAAQDEVRRAQDSSYRFMSAMAGSLEGFEEAARALFAGDEGRFKALIAPWPQDIQDHLQRLAQVALAPAAPTEQD